MPKLSKAESRDRKRSKNIHGMQVDNRSIFTILEQKQKKSEAVKKNKLRKMKEQMLEE